jgi:hypothetical protein
LSRGFGTCSCPHEPLVSFRINRQLSGWNLPPLMIRAFGAHCQKPTFISAYLSNFVSAIHCRCCALDFQVLGGMGGDGRISNCSECTGAWNAAAKTVIQSQAAASAGSLV